MKKRSLLTLGALLIAVLAAVTWIVPRWSQRTLNGKPESYWINSLVTPWNPASDAEWEALGAQAVPILVDALEKQPGAVGKAYAKMWPKLPVRVQQLLPGPINYMDMHLRAWCVLHTTKPKIPVSVVARALNDPNWRVRHGAMSCLNYAVLPNSGAEVDQFLPLVIGAAQDPAWQVRELAVFGLGYFTNQSVQVIPILTNALQNPYPDVRISAAMGLYQIDPQSAERLGGLTVAYDCAKSSGAYRASLLAVKLLEEWGKPLPAEQQ